MNLPIWKAEVDKVLIANKKTYRTRDIAEEQLQSAFDSGESPVVFAKRTDHRGHDKPAVKPPTPQCSAVLNDPKYNLDTGLGFHCPICGSTFIKPVEKSGTGLGYLGGIGWILAASVIESAVRWAQDQPFVCGYCDAGFLAKDSAKYYATAKAP
jgi:hypothetical protein